MIPSSHIGKDNYNALGNQRVGETHASRMRRVAGQQPMQTQLAPVNQPMGTVKSVVTSTPDSIVYGLVGGMLGSLIGELSAFRGISSKQSRSYGALLGVVSGSALSYFATSDTVSSEPVFEDKTTRVIVGSGVLVAGLMATGLAGMDWNRLKGQKWNKDMLNIMIPTAMLALPVMAGKDFATSTSLFFGATAAVAGSWVVHRAYHTINK
jgi:hypothetical protein